MFFEMASDPLNKVIHKRSQSQSPAKLARCNMQADTCATKAMRCEVLGSSSGADKFYFFSTISKL